MTPKPSIGVDGAFVQLSGEQQGYRDLWASVLTVAAQDLAKGGQRYGTRDWLESDVVRPGSFAWICKTLDLDADRVRGKMLAGKGRPKPHGMRGRAAARY